MNDIIIGIDLGTTNSEVAVVEAGRPRIIQVDGAKILPSMVGLADDGTLLVGRAARNQYALYPERTVRSVNRRMGEDVRLPMGEQDYNPAGNLRPYPAAPQAGRGRSQGAQEHPGLRLGRRYLRCLRGSPQPGRDQRSWPVTAITTWAATTSTPSWWNTSPPTSKNRRVSTPAATTLPWPASYGPARRPRSPSATPPLPVSKRSTC